MRVVLQRVRKASVEIDGKVVGSCGVGLLLLVGFGDGDSEHKLQPMAEKLAMMRIFPDDRGRFHYSLRDVNGGVLAVPQFTLFADTSRGRRPDFNGALRPEIAKPLFEAFPAALLAAGISHVATGVFGADMLVSLENDGPVTIIVEN